MKNFDRFDYTVSLIIMLLVMLISLVVITGDHVGVRITSYTPQDLTRGNSPIRIRFYDTMITSSVEQRFSIEPPIEGNMRWNGERELIFEPTTNFAAGQTYVVTVQKGAQSTRTELLEDFTFEFKIVLPSILYLAPSTAQPHNLYAHNLNTGKIKQFTFSEWGVADYAVSFDGSAIAYTEYNEDGTSDIWVYDVATDVIRQVTDCVNAYCGAPAWNADGTQLAYEREEYDPVFGQTGARRVWVVNLATARSTLLFDDTQIIGHSPKYSRDGSRVAIFNVDLPGIMVYNFASQTRVMIESLQGVVGDFSPDGRYLVYPILVRGAIGSTFYTQLEMVDLVNNERFKITGEPEDPIEDRLGIWRPQGDALAVARRYFDRRQTVGTQIYLLDPTTQEATPIITGETYTNGAIQWSPDGEWLVVQRFDQAAQDARPEIWAYSMLSGELMLIQADAFLPGVLP